jgi:CMP-N-acetylneuraminic acid synthetase
MNQSILILIPARKGSKGLPNKNKILLNNKPLINYTFDSALEFKNINEFDDILISLSTDDEDIINNCNKTYNHLEKCIDIPFKRQQNYLMMILILKMLLDIV